MPHRLFGLLHANAHHAAVRLRSGRGQGTVEYVALILLMAVVFAAVVAAAKGKDFALHDLLIKKLKEGINAVVPGGAA